MRCLERNKQLFYFLTFLEKTPLLDEDGNETGESVVTYNPAVSMMANISAAKGTAQIEQFGSSLSYDKVIVTEDMSCPIDENTVLFVDKEPEYAEDGTPLYDYVVKRVAKSLNSISYAISKVDVS